MDFAKILNIVNDSSNVTKFTGYCIDVFEAAAKHLDYSLNFDYVPYGDGKSNPNYDALVDDVANKRFDVAVGDITLTTDRSEKVDFAQPYTDFGLVVVVPTKGRSNHAWAFVLPFTPGMWAAMGVFILLMGLAMWILEHKKNDDFRGKPMKQIVTVLWFMFSSLFFIQRERTRSNLGKAVLIIWFFVVLIVVSSYQAYLTSILTVQQLMPTVQTFLSNSCSFTMAGHEFTKGGWGFAFPKGSQLAAEMSEAIRQIAEDGTLQKISDYWLSPEGCGTSGGLSVDSDEAGLDKFWGLFLITGTASIFCVLVHYARLIWQHRKVYFANILARSIATSSQNKRIPRSLVNSSKGKRRCEMGSREEDPEVGSSGSNPLQEMCKMYTKSADIDSQSRKAGLSEQ